jgi:hypothetical protein
MLISSTKYVRFAISYDFEVDKGLDPLRAKEERNCVIFNSIATILPYKCCILFKVVALVILVTLGSRIHGEDRHNERKSEDLETQASGK